MMGFFEDAFDFNRDGKVSIGEEFIAFSMVSALSGKQRDDSEIETNESDGDDDSDPITPITVVLNKDAEDKIQERIETIQEKLDELECDEPEDCTSSAYDHWEERCEELQGQIDELEALL